jgi:hexosaminidase
MKVLPQPFEVAKGAGVLTLGTGARIEYSDLFSRDAYAAAALLARRIGERHGLRLPVTRAGGAGKGGVLLGTLEEGAVAQAMRKAGVRNADAARRQEGYALGVSRDGAVIGGHDGAGLVNGVHTFLQLLEREGRTLRAPCGRIVDRPAHDFRAIHVYVPPKNEIPHFMRLIEFLAAAKFNTVILEIAAAVELKRHPEINRAWERYCHLARKFPYTQTDLQNFQTLHGRGKDSNHFEQGGGTCISQEDLRRILRCARENGISVVPEVQSPGHAYWLCLAHPEVAEWSGDTFPDTICPSNPRSYELLFDVMDEIIELMEPRWLLSGNDELYFFRICPRCRKRSGHDILAGHVNKVNDFLRSRGVKHIVAGDKFINPDECERKRLTESGTGNPIRWGGGERLLQDSTGSYVQGATWRAIDRIPDDVLMGDWYFGLSPDTERYFAKHRKEVVFFNFGPFGSAPAPQRLYAPNVRGGIISTWIENGEQSLAHNNFPLQAMITGDLLWSEAQRKTPARERMGFFFERWRRTRDLLHAPEDRLPSRRPEGARYRTLALPGGAAGNATPAVRVGRSDHPAPFRLAKHPIVVRPGDVTGRTVKVGGRARSILFLQGMTVKASEAKRKPLYDYSDYKEYYISMEVATLTVRAAWVAKDPRRSERHGRVPVRLGMETGTLIEPVTNGPTFCDAVLQADGTAVYVWEWVNPNPEHMEIESITLARGRSDIPGDWVVYAITVAQ